MIIRLPQSSLKSLYSECTTFLQSCSCQGMPLTFMKKQLAVVLLGHISSQELDFLLELAYKRVKARVSVAAKVFIEFIEFLIVSQMHVSIPVWNEMHRYCITWIISPYQVKALIQPNKSCYMKLSLFHARDRIFQTFCAISADFSIITRSPEAD